MNIIPLNKAIDELSSIDRQINTDLKPETVTSGNFFKLRKKFRNLQSRLDEIADGTKFNDDGDFLSITIKILSEKIEKFLLIGANPLPQQDSDRMNQFANLN